MALTITAKRRMPAPVPLEPIEKLFVAPSSFVLTMGMYRGWSLRQLVHRPATP